MRELYTGDEYFSQIEKKLEKELDKKLKAVELKFNKLNIKAKNIKKQGNSKRNENTS